MKSFYLFLLFPFTVFAQQIREVDFKSVSARITIDASEKSVTGKASYTFDILKTTDTIALDAHDMVFSNIKVNGKDFKTANTGKQLLLLGKFRKGEGRLSFDYSARPKQTLYFTGSEAADNLQVWTQGQGKYTSYWFPSIDDVNDKMIFSLSVTFNKNYEAIANGTLENKTENGASQTWNYKMKKPMSSYLLMLAIGKFEKRSLQSASGIPLVEYLCREDVSKFEPTYRHSKAIFDFLEKETGYAYPWEIYRQIPAHDFLYGGMENTTATIFAQDYVVDSTGFNDRNYINVNAHELAHHWFGDLVTAKSGKHHWLQEGFATYYALLAEQQVFGDDYFYMRLYDNAEKLQQAAKTDTIPVLSEKASSLSFYQKGAWALHVLREGVGKDNFRKAVKNYLGKYQFSNVDTDEFLAEINKVSNYDTAAFRKRWLESADFPIAEAISLMKQNPFMQRYFDLIALQEKPFSEKKEIFEKILKSGDYYPLKEEVVFQLTEVPFEEKKQLLALAMQTGDLQVRQAVANTMGKLGEADYPEYVKLLSDDSYITKEIMLGSLWQLFPEKRPELLEKTKKDIGFNDKNLRIQWLTLALMTKDYDKSGKTAHYDELLDYASAKYESPVRQNALTNLLYLDPNDTNALQALAHATVHHKWQFTKFAREKIRFFLKKEKYRTFFTELSPKLPENEQTQLNKLLKE